MTLPPPLVVHCSSTRTTTTSTTGRRNSTRHRTKRGLSEDPDIFHYHRPGRSVGLDSLSVGATRHRLGVYFHHESPAFIGRTSRPPISVAIYLSPSLSHSHPPAQGTESPLPSSAQACSHSHAARKRRASHQDYFPDAVSVVVAAAIQNHHRPPAPRPPILEPFLPASSSWTLPSPYTTRTSLLLRA